VQLAHAEQLAAWSGCGEVIGVFTARTGGGTRPRAYVMGLLPADGQAYELSRSLQNVRDPYGPVGQLLKGFMPAAVGQTMPAFPTIDEIIAAYPGRPGPRA
jgi:hypothetical protein